MSRVGDNLSQIIIFHVRHKLTAGLVQAGGLLCYCVQNADHSSGRGCTPLPTGGVNQLLTVAHIHLMQVSNGALQEDGKSLYKYTLAAQESTSTAKNLGTLSFTT